MCFAYHRNYIKNLYCGPFCEKMKTGNDTGKEKRNTGSNGRNHTDKTKKKVKENKKRPHDNDPEEVAHLLENLIDLVLKESILEICSNKS